MSNKSNRSKITINNTVMEETTLGYIKYKGSYLMLLRDKKENDLNAMKWIGVGGHVEIGETADECFVREVLEETGIELSLGQFDRVGTVDFISDIYENERMYLYVGYVKSPEFKECDEGTLEWIPEDEIMGLNLWEGDKLFLKPLIEGKKDINLTLSYEGDKLISCKEAILF